MLIRPFEKIPRLIPAFIREFRHYTIVNKFEKPEVESGARDPFLMHRWRFQLSSQPTHKGDLNIVYVIAEDQRGRSVPFPIRYKLEKRTSKSVKSPLWKRANRCLSRSAWIWLFDGTLDFFDREKTVSVFLIRHDFKLLRVVSTSLISCRVDKSQTPFYADNYLRNCGVLQFHPGFKSQGGRRLPLLDY